MLTHSLVTDQIKQDIEWVLSSPSMMALPASLDAHCWLQAQQVDINHASLDEHIITKRLGSYYENIINEILKNIPHLRDIKRNIQVKDDSITRGEFDFLFRSNTGECFHLECAIKFYLCTHHGSTLAEFEGPNRQDRLDLKWDKLLHKQSNLSDTLAGTKTASSLGLHPNRKLILLQGVLFYPFGNAPSPTHSAIHPQHQKGWWLRASDHRKLVDADYQFQILTKPHWLALPKPDKDLLLDEKALTELAATLDHPRLMARLKRTNRGWEEVDRGFVVPDNW